MALLQPFRAHRYDLGRVGALSDVTAPPYDVIDAGIQAKLYNQSPYNVIRIELSKDQPGDNADGNRYTRAAQCVRDWTNDGIWRQDSARGLYVYHQQFEVEGKRYVRKGFFGRIGVQPFETGTIVPHEETIAGPKADRLTLLKTLKVQTSPVFGLFPDPNNEVQQLLDNAVLGQPALEAKDDLGVVNRLWPVTDSNVISKVVGLMGPKRVYIADGHHRYETALNYLREAGDVPADSPARFTMMALVGMSDPGLLILPTHRLWKFIKPVTAENVKAWLADSFELETVGKGPSAAHAAWELMEADGNPSILGFGLPGTDGEWFLARFQKPELMERLTPTKTPRWRGLGVSILKAAVLDHLVPESLRQLAAYGYVHDVPHLIHEMERDQMSLAVLTPPASLEDLEKISGAGERMPAKSTYFYPKLLTGLLFSSLTSH